MNHFLLIIFILAGLISCDGNQMTKKERQGEPNIYSTKDDDKEMNSAIATARSTLDQFDKALKSNRYDTNTFALKVKFITSNGSEHIWATGITVKNAKYFGIIDNLPDMITTVKWGDKVELSKEDISDWMYSDNGKLRGGYTIKLIRNRMTREEKRRFDSTFQLKVED